MQEPKSGIFVVFEGPEGASKSTQSRKFTEYLKQKNIPFYYTREPDGPIRTMLLDPANAGKIDDSTEVLLYAASRVNKYKLEIEPALKEGKVVVCDRFVESSIAYQGYAGGIGADTVQAVHNAFLTDERITLLFDIPYEISRQRIGDRGISLDRLESKSEEYHRRVIEGYRMLADENPHVVKIDATRSIEEIFDDVLKTIEPILLERGLL